MKTKTILVLMLMLMTISVAVVSCKKDSASPSGGSVPPVNPTNCDDPEGTITANLRNDYGEITILGTSLRINVANNFIGGNDDYTLTFANIGEVDGLGCVNTIPSSGWTNQIAVYPANGYVAKCFHENMISYAKIYVIGYILNANNEILGAEIKYQDNWEPYPIVITKDVTNITGTSATCGGIVTNEGVSIVTERGICWNTLSKPTINDTHASSGSGVGEYTIQITDLTPNTIYYVRAYAKNQIGISYGTEKIINLPIGAIEGVFSVSDSQKVFFSKGNLQYQASTDTWKFAENQKDIIGGANSNISPTYSGWTDLFGWSTGNNPTNNSTNAWDYNSTFVDWGINPISNGGNVSDIWYTLTEEKWDYVINHRNTPSGFRFAKACLDGVNGLILFPDNWNQSQIVIGGINNNSTNYNNNIINGNVWSIDYEANGAVFLPAAGSRNGTNVADINSWGEYQTATYDNTNHVYAFVFGTGIGIWHNQYYDYRYLGRSVRLVCNAN